MTAPYFEVLAYEPTELGMLCLRRRELLCDPGVIVSEVTLNHEFLMSSYLTESERALARLGLEKHGGTGLKVLVGGLGLGYTANEVLESERVAAVEVVEFLQPVIDWLHEGLVPLSEKLLADSRLKVIRGDVYGRLAGPAEKRYDLILIDVDHAPDEQLGENGEFYRVAGLRQAAEHLEPGGVLGVWSYAEDSQFAEALRSVFDEVSIERVTVWNNLIDCEQTDWLYFGRG